MKVQTHRILKRWSKGLACLLLVNSLTCSSQAPLPSQNKADHAGLAAPEAADPEVAAARILLQQGKYDDAISRLSALAAKQPGLKGLSAELGAAYYKKGDYINAISSFKQTLVEDPNNR